MLRYDISSIGTVRPHQKEVPIASTSFGAVHDPAPSLTNSIAFRSEVAATPFGAPSVVVSRVKVSPIHDTPWTAAIMRHFTMGIPELQCEDFGILVSLGRFWNLTHRYMTVDHKRPTKSICFFHSVTNPNSAKKWLLSCGSRVLLGLAGQDMGICRRAILPLHMIYVISICLLLIWSLDPTTVLSEVQSASYQEALEKYRNKDYPGALAAARRALQEDGNNASYFHIYGLTLAAVQQFKEAEENLQKAIALKPDEANFHYDYAYVLYQQKKYDQAVPVLQRAVDLDGENLMARFLLGRTYVSSHRSLRIGNFSQLALEQFAFIAKRNPRFPSVHLHMARIYSNNGDEEKALQELTTELDLYPKDTPARVEMGELLLKMGRSERAVEHLIQAEKEAPGVPLVHYTLAKAYRARSQMREAVKAAQRCVELDPDFAEGHYVLGQLYQETGQPDLVRREMEVFQEKKRLER
jgi:tetratricopeptide (TPR) repeat protein